MMKKLFAMLLLALLVFALPAQAETISIPGITASAPEDMPSNDELFAEFALRELYGMGDVSFFGTSARAQLPELMQKLYDKVKPEIEKIAAGDRSSTEISFTVAELAAMGFTTSGSYTTGEEFNAIANQFSSELNGFGKLFSALLRDCPYDMYWCDYTIKSNITSGGYSGTNGNAELQEGVTLHFPVAAKYRATESNAYVVDTAKAKATLTAANNAQAIVTANASKTAEEDRLKAYRDAICERVVYDTAAAENNTFSTDIDPWQLISVFDGDSDTNVVCEGYSKAFQYLCDLDGDLTCYTVSGYMVGGTGEGPHMWNIVTLDDKNYLVDVTNSDSGTVGHDGSLFLEPAVVGSADAGYMFLCNNGYDLVYFIYDDDLIWPNSVLAVEANAVGYSVTCTSDDNGKVVADTLIAAEGDYVYLTITPDDDPNTSHEDYELDKVTLNGEEIELLEDHGNLYFVMPAHNVELHVTFKEAPSEFYDVWVGGKRLTNLYKSDTGWSYDPVSNTLTLNGANIQGVYDGTSAHSAGIYHGYSENGTFTIHLNEGTNNKVTGCTHQSIYPMGIYSMVDVVIEGSGKLDVSAHQVETTQENCYGILVANEADLTIKGGTIIASASNDGNITYGSGIRANDILISDGNVTAYLNYKNGAPLSGTVDAGAAIYGDSSVTIEGGTVKAYTGSCNNDSCGIGTPWEGTIIITGGDVTAVGSTGLSSLSNSYGLGTGTGGLTIGKGAGTITATAGQGTNSYGIGSRGSVTIEGGIITATGGKATDGSSYGIGADCLDNNDETTGEVLISAGKVTATGGTATNGNSFGIGSTGSLKIWGGSEVEATGGTANGGASYGLGSVKAITIGTSTVKAVGSTLGIGSNHTIVKAVGSTLGIGSNDTISLNQDGSTTVEAIGNAMAIRTQGSVGGDTTDSKFSLNTVASAANAVKANSVDFTEEYKNYKYIKMEPGQWTSTITFDLDGGAFAEGVENSITAPIGSAVTVPADPSKAGYTFDGWDAVIPAIMPAENVTVKATWQWIPVVSEFYTMNTAGVYELTERIEYTEDDNNRITPSLAEGFTVDAEMSTGDNSTMPAPNEEGKIVLTWYIKRDQYTLTTIVDEETTETTYYYGATVTAPADPSKTGYTFAGWEPEVPATMPAKDVIIKATWTINTYAVALVSEPANAADLLFTDRLESIVSGETVTVRVYPSEVYELTALIVTYGNETITPDANPQDSGEYTFTMPASDVTVKATFMPLYAINFDPNGGELTSGGVDKYVLITDVNGKLTKDHIGELPYGFWLDGYLYDHTNTMRDGSGVKIDENYVFTEDTTVFVQWKPITYIVTFNGSGGEGAMEDQKIKYGTATPLSKNKFTREGYTFAGWQDGDGNSYKDEESVKNLRNEDNTKVYLNAQWEINQYKITFDTDGGTVVATVDDMSVTQAQYGDTVTLTVEPANGYMLDTLKVDGIDVTDAVSDNQYSFTMPASDVNVTATFAEAEAAWGTSASDLPNRGTLSKALEAAAADPSIKYIKLLKENMVSNSGWKVEGGTFTLDLNGKTLSSSSYTLDLRGGNVTIDDSTTAKAGKIMTDGSGSAAVVLCNHAEVTLAGGTMQGVTMGINCLPDGKVIMTGGKVIGTEYGIVNEDGILEITGGTIKAGNVYVVVQGTTTIDADKVIFEAGEGETLNYYRGDLTVTGSADNVDGWTLYMAALPGVDDTITLPDNICGKLNEQIYSLADFEKGETYTLVKGYTLAYVKIVAGEYEVLETYLVEGGDSLPGFAGSTDRTGYTFVGWKDAWYNTPAPTTMPERDLDLVGEWKVNEYTITFETEGGTAVEAITADYGATVTVPANPKKTGYIFAGWVTKDAAGKETAYAIPETMPANDVTVFAKWEPADGTAYMVKHHYQTVAGDYIENESEATEHKGITGEKTEAVANEKKGFTAKAIEQQNIAADGSTVVNVYYDRNQYTLTTIVDDKTTEATYYYEEAVTVENPEKTGYTFAGWVTKDAEGKETAYTIPATMPAANVTVYAKWTEVVPTTYTVTVENGSGSGEYAENATVSITANAPGAGKEFAGWTTADGVTFADATAASTTFTMPAKAVTVTATYKEIPVKYTVTVNTEGDGTATATPNESIAGEEIKLAAFAKDGSTFKEWKGLENVRINYGDLTEPDCTIIMPEQDLVVTAVFEKVSATTYTVTVENGSGSGEYAENATVSITANAPGAGKEFAGWTTADGVTFADATAASTTFTMPAKAVTVTATYKDIPVIPTTYTVTFVDWDGTELKKETVEAGQAATAPAEPSREGYTFKGWDVDFTNVTADLTVTALYEKIKLPDPEIVFPTSDQIITVYEGEKAEMSIETRNVVSYQWYINYNDGSGWHKCGGNSPVYVTSPTTLSNDGNRYKCIVAGESGKTVESHTFTLVVLEKVEVPETGDSASIGLWMTMWIFSFMGMLSLVVGGKKRKTE